MAAFRYRARSSSGEVTRGTIEAVSRDEAARELREQGLYPSSIEPVQDTATVDRPAWGGVRISATVRAMFWRQAGQAQNAGMGLDRTLGLLAGGQHGRLSRFSHEAIPAASAGSPLSELMRGSPSLFGPIEHGLVRAGEASGRLDTQMFRLADYFEAETRNRQAMAAPLAYVGCVALVFALVLFIVAVVAPAIAARDSGGTNIVASTLRFLLPFVALGVILVFARLAYRGSEPLRAVLDRAKVSIPVAGGLFRKLAIARFTRAMAELLGAGVPVGDAVELSADAAGNRHITARLGGVPAMVREGVPLSQALIATGQFPPQVVQMLITGEETGTADQMLAKVSEYYEGEAAAATRQLITISMVLLFLALAVAIGAFVIGFFANLYGEVFKLVE